MSKNVCALPFARRFLGVLGVVTLAATPIAAHAQNLYAGLSVGQFEDEVLDDSDTAYKVFGGYQFMENFAVELTYADFGTVKEGGVEFDQTTFAVAGVGILPIGPQASVFGKIGINSWDVDAQACAGGTCVSGSDSGTDPMYGVGFSYDFMMSTSVRVEYEWFEDDIGQLLSAGVSFKF